MKVNSAYEEHRETILRQQVLITQLTQEKAALEASIMEKEIFSRQQQSESASRSWKGKIRRLIGAVLDK
jgi:hypothetical protein